jgi:hypothetical protein
MKIVHIIINIINTMFDLVSFIFDYFKSFLHNFVYYCSEFLLYVAHIPIKIVSAIIDFCNCLINLVCNIFSYFKLFLTYLHDKSIQLNKNAQDNLVKAESTINTVAYAINHDRTNNGLIHIVLQCAKNNKFEKSMLKGVTFSAFKNDECLKSKDDAYYNLKLVLNEKFVLFFGDHQTITTCVMNQFDFDPYMCN